MGWLVVATHRAGRDRRRRHHRVPRQRRRPVRGTRTGAHVRHPDHGPGDGNRARALCRRPDHPLRRLAVGLPAAGGWRRRHHRRLLRVAAGDPPRQRECAQLLGAVARVARAAGAAAVHGIRAAGGADLRAVLRIRVAHAFRDDRCFRHGQRPVWHVLPVPRRRILRWQPAGVPLLRPSRRQPPDQRGASLAVVRRFRGVGTGLAWLHASAPRVHSDDGVLIRPGTGASESHRARNPAFPELHRRGLEHFWFFATRAGRDRGPGHGLRAGARLAAGVVVLRHRRRRHQSCACRGSRLAK